jgi:hypothetical protein
MLSALMVSEFVYLLVEFCETEMIDERGISVCDFMFKNDLSYKNFNYSTK